MSLLTLLKTIFTPVDKDKIEIEDNLQSFKISYRFQKNPSIKIHDLINLFSATAPESVNLKIKRNELLSFEFEETTEEFIQENFSYLERAVFVHNEDNDDLSVEYVLNKTEKNGVTVVYDPNRFLESVTKKLPLSKLLEIVKSKLEANQKIGFEFHKSVNKRYLKHSIETTHIFYGERADLQSKEYKNDIVKEFCHYDSYLSYPFKPEVFHLLKSGSNEKINDLFSKLCLTFCVTSIFDVSSFSGESLTYKLNGYKSYNTQVSFNNINTEHLDQYYKIYNWVYSEESKVSDRIELARNIISLFLEEDTLRLKKDAYHSILSSYKTYLKKNVKTYIELRKNIQDELSWISQKSSEIVNNHLSNLYKSLFTFISLFISIIVLRVLKTGNSNNIISFDAYVISVGFLLLPIIFLFFSNSILKSEKNRLKRKYNNLKDRYLDVLAKEDIESILESNGNADGEFEYEISYIDEMQLRYNMMWVISIVLLFIIISIVYSTSHPLFKWILYTVLYLT